jgi:hypothetical protein
MSGIEIYIKKSKKDVYYLERINEFIAIINYITNDCCTQEKSTHVKYNFKEFFKTDFSTGWSVMVIIMFVLQCISLLSCTQCPDKTYTCNNNGGKNDNQIECMLNNGWFTFADTNNNGKIIMDYMISANTGATCGIVYWNLYNVSSMIYNATLEFVNPIGNHSCYMTHLYVHLTMIFIWMFPYLETFQNQDNYKV